jgi:hypothetical protein
MGALRVFRFAAPRFAVAAGHDQHSGGVVIEETTR